MGDDLLQEIKELKARGYDLLLQIDLYIEAINKLRKELDEVEKKIHNIK